jgi:hypothetical protein
VHVQALLGIEKARGTKHLPKGEAVDGESGAAGVKAILIFRPLIQNSRRRLESAMSKSSAFWVAFISAFIASGLALRVAFRLGIAANIGGQSFLAELDTQSRVAAVAGLAALVSAIAQIIEKASK